MYHVLSQAAPGLLHLGDSWGVNFFHLWYGDCGQAVVGLIRSPCMNNREWVPNAGEVPPTLGGLNTCFSTSC